MGDTDWCTLELLKFQIVSFDINPAETNFLGVNLIIEYNDEFSFIKVNSLIKSKVSVFHNLITWSPSLQVKTENLDIFIIERMTFFYAIL
jgi:hypothetical protein